MLPTLTPALSLSLTVSSVAATQSQSAEPRLSLGCSPGVPLIPVSAEPVLTDSLGELHIPAAQEAVPGLARH